MAANPFYADQLGTELASPLIKITRLLYDKHRRPVQHLTIHIWPERSRRESLRSGTAAA